MTSDVHDPRWDDAIDLLIAGMPKSRIAERLVPPVHRNTIGNWLRDPRFLRELHRRLDERDALVRLRRAHQASRYVDRLHLLADQALRAAENRPLDPAASRVVRLWLDMFRKMVATERQAG
jgi:hypothetical protein